MITPLKAFIDWFDALSLDIKANLAHIFRVCTVDDLTLMVESSENSLISFRVYLLKEDFALRKIARLYLVRSVFDMIIIHSDLILKSSGVLGPGEKLGNIIDFSSAKWRKTCNSWKNLRSQHLSDTYMNFWAGSVIGKQMEEF
jgi:hypothetical protein